MTKEQLIQHLIDNKLVIQIGQEYYPVDKKLGIIGGKKCQNLPDKYNGVSIKQSYQFFMDDCKIPHKSEKDIVYLLREETKESLSVLSKILQNPLIDYNTLVSKTTAYYKTISGIKPVKKYLSEGTWEAVYNAPLLSSKENKDYVDKM